MGVKEVSPPKSPSCTASSTACACRPTCRSEGLRDGDANAERLRDGPFAQDDNGHRHAGILEMLDSAELEGVMAHELTHVINRDVMVMTLAGFFASLAC